MEMLGLVRFNLTPNGYMVDAINQDTFTDEAKKALDLQMRSFLA
jgi:hypothetical protein